MAYADYLSSSGHPSDHKAPLYNTAAAVTNGTHHGMGRTHSHLFLSPSVPHLFSHHFMAPPHHSTHHQTSLCPLCYLPFNPALSYSGTCPNCTFKLPTTLSPNNAPSFYNPTSSNIRPPPSSKKSTSSLSSSGSSSSSITSPDYGNNETFSMSTLLNVVDDVLREDELVVTSQPFNGGGLLLCVSCGSSSEHLSFCIDCQKYFCTTSCVSFHPADHRFVSLTSLSPPPPLPISSPSHSYIITEDLSLPSYKDSCDRHIGKPVCHFCKTCLMTLCYECIQEGGHQKHSHFTINEAYQSLEHHFDSNNLYARINGLQKASENIEKLTSSIIQNKDETIIEVQRIFRQQREELERREKEVIAAVNAVTTKRLTSLQDEKHDIEKSRKSLTELNLQLKSHSLQDQQRTAIIVLNHYKLEKEMKKLSLSDVDLLAEGRHSVEDDSLLLLSNNSNINSAIHSFCHVTTPPYPPHCTISGEGLFHSQTNRLSSVILTTKNRMGGACKEGGERVMGTLTQIGHSTIPLDIVDNMDGTYIINFRPRNKGEFKLAITIRGHHVKGSPFQLNVEMEREYGRVGVVSRVFGTEGSGPGEFCRPWGICSDQKGHIIIGDRSNHRIQVFDSDGRFLYMFGSEGRQTGQFNRPAGVAITREGNIVVADKDNHRIQIFKLDGTFLFTFGKKGGKDGEMVYPYDVDVSPVDGRIVTTDTGNHRILIFSHDGVLLGKFGYKGYLCNHFDSPRGIAINREGHIIVSDFNVHHVLVIHPDGTTARILGSHGSGNAQFTRPQGIAVDNSGNFVIADTRNNRIVIMHPSGGFITKFGCQGSGRGQFDRPTSVTVLPDGRIAVMDFGNSRIQIF